MIKYLMIIFTFLHASSYSIDASDWENWVYIKFDILGSPAIVYPENPQDNLGWDIGCHRYHIRTNSGLSGKGNGGAYIDSINTWTSDLYNSITEVPINSFFVRDSTIGTFYDIETHELYPGVANPALETWGSIDIDNNYLMEYSNNQFIVRDALGTSFYKVWVVNYYNENGTSGHITIIYDEINSCSLGHDDCGECNGDNSACYGCMDELACNYNMLVNVDNDSCEYEDEDLDGICDSNDDCVGEYDKCDVCGGDNSTCANIDDLMIPQQLQISKIYPNPFNPTTQIFYDVPISGHLHLSIYNIHGQKLTTLINGYQAPGYHQVSWNGQSQASGIYFLRMIGDGFVETQKLILMK